MTQIKRKGDGKMTKFKTVKRKAEVGEQILITNAVPVMEQAYENGAIFTVRATNASGPNDVYVHGLKTLIEGMEYEVIIENETEAGGMNELKDKLAEVAEIAQKLSITFNDIASMLTTAESIKETVEKSPQQIRDEIIEKAKRDVAELSTTWRPGCPSLNYRPSAFDPSSETVNFSVNRDKRSVVCYITYWSKVNQRTQTSFRGIAKCAPDDCFNVHIGRAIALRRALGLEVPSEYLNAPQPTEVQVGNIIKSNRHGYVETVIALDGNKMRYDDEEYDFISRIDEGIIRVIDDSRENETN